jgi:type III pantothenate kinase
MNLVIDIGNSRIKLAVFDHKELVYSTQTSSDQFEKKLLEVTQNYHCKCALISNVGQGFSKEFKSLFNNIQVLELSQTTTMPFKNQYHTPETLGVDRMALAAAATVQFPKKNVLVIDAGSCITYDYVNDNGDYLGGAISPGLGMRYKSVHEFTENLPLLEITSKVESIGRSTAESIHSGIIKGVVSEIEDRISKFAEKSEDLTVVLTGGDVNFLADKLKNGIFANPNFLLEGLNSILIHNIE